jgi:hypothetical protein
VPQLELGQEVVRPVGTRPRLQGSGQPAIVLLFGVPEVMMSVDDPRYPNGLTPSPLARAFTLTRLPLAVG